MAESTITSLERGLRLLQAFRPDDATLGNAELAERTGLAKSTVSRLTATLAETGFLEPSLTGRQQYRLGAAAMDVAGCFLQSRPFLAEAQTHIDILARETGCAIAIAERDRMNMLYLCYARPDAALALTLERGTRIPLLTTAAGRAWMAAASADERTAMLAAGELDHRQNAGTWQAISQGIDAAVRDFSETGFCRSYGDWNRDVNAIAVPFRWPFDGRVYVINAGGPSFHISPSRMEQEVLPALRQTVTTILGGATSDESDEAAG